MDILKVASQSNHNAVLGAIVGALEHDGVVELHAIGAGAMNQTIKTLSIARRLIERPGDSPLKVVPGLFDALIHGESRTGHALRRREIGGLAVHSRHGQLSA